MRIECSGPNGETFEFEFQHLEHQTLTKEWINLTDNTNRERLDAAQKALETWCFMIAEDKEAEK